MPLKFVTVNDNVFQLLGDFVLQTPSRGSAPGPRWETSVPRPHHFLCSSKISFKNTLLKFAFPSVWRMSSKYSTKQHTFAQLSSKQMGRAHVYSRISEIS